MKTFRLFHLSIFLFVFSVNAQSQSCSRESIQSKYWQYRENFNKHFIAIDRDPSGCINDGIGQDSNTPCDCSVSGLSLPGTSINIEPFGSDAMKDRWSETEAPLFNNRDCFDNQDGGDTHDASWDASKPQKHNYLDMGSETPHQLGFYYIMLATEYELLGRSGQTAEQQRVLEELFLALQAYRRLDIRANCIARERYQEITDDYEVEDCSIFMGPTKDCLCGPKYTAGKEAGKHFDNPCDDHCDYEPNTTGYSGFFIREDATQALENILHDDSEDRWNIDAIGSAYSASLKPPCRDGIDPATGHDYSFSQACYLVRHQHFMSQDQAIPILLGLAFVKRFIPEQASITTCEGEVFRPLDIAKNIAGGIVDRINDAYRQRIVWPKSKDCCERESWFPEHAGGAARSISYGLNEMGEYIDGKKRNTGFFQKTAYAGFLKSIKAAPEGNGGFFLKIKAVTGQLSTPPPTWWLFPSAYIPFSNLGIFDNATNPTLVGISDRLDRPIYPMMYNVLHPGEAGMNISRQELENMLCSAPCGNPCIKQDDFDTAFPNGPEFDCSNTPNWLGQRWEGSGTKELTWKDGNRVFNGLDFMTLYNMYLLQYPSEAPMDYYNPQRAQNAYAGTQYISGPSALCPVNTAHYEMQLLYPPVDPENPGASILDISWFTSSNLEILSEVGNGADIRANTAASGSYVEAVSVQQRKLVQWGGFLTRKQNGKVDDVDTYQTEGRVTETCDISYRKPIYTEGGVEVDIVLEPCFPLCRATADSPVLYEQELTWQVGWLSSQDYYIDFCEVINPNVSGSVTINLQVESPACGTYNMTFTEYYDACPYPTINGIRVQPNPTSGSAFIFIDRQEGEYVVPASGVDVMIVPAAGNLTPVNMRIYSNGEQVTLNTLPEGYYLIRATADNLLPVTGSFTISRQ